jgi:N-acetylglutamate synthase-like GNAT family acetyltransferase
MTDDENLTIRLATTDDMKEVMELAVNACKENAFLNASAALLAMEIWPALQQDHGLCAVIGPDGGEIQGLVLLRTGHMWYSETPVLEEKAVFIHPKYRSAKGGRAHKLVEFSKRTADKLGMPLIMGVLSHTRTAGKTRLYTRMFGEPAGAFFLYNARAEPGHEVH